MSTAPTQVTGERPYLVRIAEARLAEGSSWGWQLSLPQLGGKARDGGTVRGTREAAASPLPTPEPTCQLPLQAAHTLCQAQCQGLQPGGCLWAWHLGELKLQSGGPPRKGQGCSDLLESESHGLLLEGCPGEGDRGCVLGPDPPAPSLPLLPAQGSPEMESDVFRRIQAKTGFLQGTEAGHHLPETLEPLATPQTCPT